MKKEEMFDRLVENGLDFLSRAILDLRESPKYSVIHFHAAVELLVKARLMNEHWSLVVAKKQDPDWNKFVSGDFQSVSLDEAANRLDKVVGSGLSATELEAFREVGKHRNKMVHFFHEESLGEDAGELTRSIVKKQLKAWYFLHQLMTVQWKEIFSNWSDKIVDIDTALRKQHEFLQVIFDNLGAEIKRLEGAGKVFEQCPSCEFTAQQHDLKATEIYEAKCLVCGLTEKCLRIECPGCDEMVIFRNEGYATCHSCDRSLEPDDVAEALGDSGAALAAAMEGDNSWDVGNCADCDSYHTVVRIENDSWVCSNCFGEYKSIGVCEWCNEPNTGDLEYSYIKGCSQCGGREGWDDE